MANFTKYHLFSSHIKKVFHTKVKPGIWNAKDEKWDTEFGKWNRQNKKWRCEVGSGMRKMKSEMRKVKYIMRNVDPPGGGLCNYSVFHIQATTFHIPNISLS